MKHIFYVIYVLFYTGAVFITGLFVGQMLERSWEARRSSRQGSNREERAELQPGAVAGRGDNAAVSKQG